MKKLFLGLCVLFGVLLGWAGVEYLMAGAGDEKMMIVFFAIMPVTLLFVMSLFLWFRESKMPIGQTNSFDRVFRVIVMFLIILVLLFVFLPGLL